MVADRMPPEHCGTGRACKFWLEQEGSVGLCRRFPPQIIPTTEGLLALFPTMQPIGWCGEHKTKVILQ